MQKTALTEIIYYAEEHSNDEFNNGKYWEGYKAAMQEIKQKAISLLSKEREDIEEAFIKGSINEYKPKSEQITRHIYFKNTFTQYKP